MRNKKRPIRRWKLFRRGSCVYRCTLARRSPVGSVLSVGNGRNTASSRSACLFLTEVSEANAWALGLSTVSCLHDANLSTISNHHLKKHRACQVHELTQWSSGCVIRSKIACCNLLQIVPKICTAKRKRGCGTFIIATSRWDATRGLLGARYACPQGTRGTYCRIAT